MSEWHVMLDESWDNLKPYLAGSFTTQTFQALVQDKAPSVWDALVQRYGPGGKGSGQFFSPNNILHNYLKYKSNNESVISHRGFVPSSPGWGSHIVTQWELAGEIAPPPAEEDRTFIEGAQKLRTHLVRERAPGLRNHVLASRADIGLSCDICGDTGEELGDDLRSALFEVHHKTAPLAEAEKTTTRIEDVALLCACCHRLIHRLVSMRGRWITVDEAQSVLPVRSKRQ